MTKTFNITITPAQVAEAAKTGTGITIAVPLAQAQQPARSAKPKRAKQPKQPKVETPKAEPKPNTFAQLIHNIGHAKRTLGVVRVNVGVTAERERLVACGVALPALTESFTLSSGNVGWARVHVPVPDALRASFAKVEAKQHAAHAKTLGIALPQGTTSLYVWTDSKKAEAQVRLFDATQQAEVVAAIRALFPATLKS